MLWQTAEAVDGLFEDQKLALFCVGVADGWTDHSNFVIRQERVAERILAVTVL